MGSPPAPSFTIIVDSREQKPWSFPQNVQIKRAGLKSGDYSILGFEDRIAIERKSLIDLYNTVGQGRARFERELERLAELDHAAIVIEATWYQIVRQPPERSLMNPKSVIASLEAWEQRYRIPVHAYGQRSLAARLAYRKLERFYRDAIQ